MTVFLLALLVLATGYLLGSIPFSVLVARSAGVDILATGSGNPGATNVLRTMGKIPGYLVFSRVSPPHSGRWFSRGTPVFTPGSPSLG